MRRVVAALLLMCAGNVAGFQVLASLPSLRHAADGVRGACQGLGQCKARSVRSLRMLDDAAVAKNMETIAAGKGPARAPTKLFKALKKSSGAIAAGCEFKRVEDDTDSLTTEASVDLRQLGMKLRRNKVAVLLVDCSSAAGKEDCEIAVKEQLTAKGGFPGPMPVVRSGSITTVEDIAEAHALGASGVLLSMSEGAADEMLKACQALGIEAIVHAASSEEIEQAVAAGAKLVACSVSLRDAVPKDVGAVGLLDARVENPEDLLAAAASDDAPTPQVITAMQELKDSKFSAIIAMDATRSAAKGTDRTFTVWLLEQILSKASGKFAKLTKTPAPGKGNPLAAPSGILYEAQ